MKIHLIRHGQTDWNNEHRLQGSKDIPLNQTGINQAVQTANYLKKIYLNPDVIYSSNRIRAYKTAMIIGETFNMVPIVDESLAEICFGRWEGQIFSDLPILFPDEYNNWEKNKRYSRIDGAETYDELLRRTIISLKNIIFENKNADDIIIVSHGAVICCLLTHISNPNWIELDMSLMPENLKMTTVDSEEILKINL